MCSFRGTPRHLASAFRFVATQVQDSGRRPIRSSRWSTAPVYPIQLPRSLPAGAARPARSGVHRNVVFLGLTSLFTDISSEMVSAVLPLYLVFYLRLTPLEFGIVDGLSQGISALVRVGAGYCADRWQRLKEVAGVGYGLSALCRLGLLAAGSAWTGLAAVVVLDRVGKGLRTAPRDALISLSSTPATLGLAFGVHRALDTTGAMLGPLCAFALLALIPNGFDAVFVASFCAAVIGLGVLVLFVENRGPTAAARREPPALAAATLWLWREPRLRILVCAAVALSLATMGDGFLYLGLQRRLGFSAGFLPLLFVGTALCYLILAVPFGRLADRVGRARVLIAGYALLLLVYLAALLAPEGLPLLLACLVLLGAHYAATDGVLMALASAVVPAALRTSGLALLTTATALARLVAAVTFGALWTWLGLESAIVLYVIGLLGATALAALILLPGERQFHDEPEATS
jgi:MFS family permease